MGSRWIRKNEGQVEVTQLFAARGGDLVHLVSLVYLVCLVRRTRETRQTRAPDRLPLNHPPLAQRSLPLQSHGYAIDFAVDSRITVC
jgi:hypothetical protein